MDKVGKDTLKVMEKANWYNSWLFNLIKPFVYGEVLEVGAGIGSFTKLLIKESKLTIIDLNEGYLSFMKKRYGKKVQIGYGNIETADYFFKKKRFDTIICFNVLEHIKKDGKTIENISNLLKNNGRLILLVPAHSIFFSKFDKNLGHYRRYSKGEIESKVESKGFIVEKIKYINWWAAIGWFVFVKLARKENIPTKQVSIFEKFGKVFLWPEKYINSPFGLSVLVVAKKI